MKVIAFEEHYKTHAIHQANKAHPIEQIYDRWNKLGRFVADPSRGIPTGIFDLDDKRVAAMDAAGIDVQILSHTVPGPEELEPSLALDLAKQANDAAHATVTKYPDRFLAFATLPMRDPKAAADELERTVRKLGFVERAEYLNVPIYLHPNRPPQPVVSAYYEGFNPIVSGFMTLAGFGWHLDAGIHSMRLIFGGVFDRFPRLQIIAGHHFEALSWIGWRANHAFPPKDTGLKRYIVDYLRQNFYGGILAGDFGDQVPGEIDPSWSLSFNAYSAMVDFGQSRALIVLADNEMWDSVRRRRSYDRGHGRANFATDVR